MAVAGMERKVGEEDLCDDDLEVSTVQDPKVRQVGTEGGRLHEVGARKEEEDSLSSAGAGNAFLFPFCVLLKGGGGAS